MSFNFLNLDPVTRKHMLSEIDTDVSSSKLYMSKHFRDGVADQYKSLIQQAAGQHSERAIRKLDRDAPMPVTAGTRIARISTYTLLAICV
jgi:hypothetical protein